MTGVTVFCGFSSDVDPFINPDLRFGEQTAQASANRLITPVTEFPIFCVTQKKPPVTERQFWASQKFCSSTSCFTGFNLLPAKFLSASELLASWRRLGQHVIQRFGCLGSSLAALDDILRAHRFSIQSFVGIVIAIHRRTFEGHARKQSLRT